MNESITPMPQYTESDAAADLQAITRSLADAAPNLTPIRSDDDTDYLPAAAAVISALINALADDDPNTACATLLAAAITPESEMSQDLLTASCGGFEAPILTPLAAAADPC